MPAIMTATKKRMPMTFAGDLQRDQYVERPPINRTFARVMRAIVQNSDEVRRKKLVMALGMAPSEAKSHDSVGVFTAHIDHFTCTLNWTDQSAGNIPSGHILVEYGGEELGMLAPFTKGTLKDGTPCQNWWKGRMVTEDYLEQVCDLKEAAATAIATAMDKAGTKKHVDLFDHYGGESAQANKSIA